MIVTRDSVTRYALGCNDTREGPRDGLLPKTGLLRCPLGRLAMGLKSAFPQCDHLDTRMSPRAHQQHQRNEAKNPQRGKHNNVGRRIELISERVRNDREIRDDHCGKNSGSNSAHSERPETTEDV